MFSKTARRAAHAWVSQLDHPRGTHEKTQAIRTRRHDYQRRGPGITRARHDRHLLLSQLGADLRRAYVSLAIRSLGLEMQIGLVCSVRRYSMGLSRFPRILFALFTFWAWP